jgi:hypothetical protein
LTIQAVVACLARAADGRQAGAKNHEIREISPATSRRTHALRIAEAAKQHVVAAVWIHTTLGSLLEAGTESDWAAQVADTVGGSEESSSRQMYAQFDTSAGSSLALQVRARPAPPEELGSC